MNCIFEEVKEGLFRCASCGTERNSSRKRQCGIHGPLPFEATLKTAEKAKLESAAKQSGMLLGDAIAALTNAIGIPPCGGCEKRKAWLNAAHAWLIGQTPQEQPNQPSTPPQ